MRDYTPEQKKAIDKDAFEWLNEGFVLQGISGVISAEQFTPDQWQAAMVYAKRKALATWGIGAEWVIDQGFKKFAEMHPELSING